MEYNRPAPERNLLDFGPRDLLQHYPNLPTWAVHAFQSLQGPQRLWTPEARALLNMGHVPPAGMLMGDLALQVGTTSDELKASFTTKEKWQRAKKEIDLWRLSRDLIGAKNGGWKQSGAKKTLGSCAR
ncbi:hypothetical protein E8E12_008636 [Didymella heteroderae]|uniref:Uncharacterized protein n=1 Tax=Didymella heteroderae TaxID=1769908 RepID=A0A9P5BZR7_9PLEO|nr:hypothetical protein E8E12_008636 [Didymella heteroderae]